MKCVNDDGEESVCTVRSDGVMVRYGTVRTVGREVGR